MTSGPGPRVPSWLRTLLDRVQADALLGDILEEYHARMRPERGALRARIWFWKHVLAGATAGLRAHARPRPRPSSRPGTPSGEIMGRLLRDVRYAVRMLGRTPGTSLIAVLTIALGVGITTQTFSTVYGSVIRGMPFEDGQPLLHLSVTVPADGIVGENATIHDYEDWRAQQTSFEDLAGFYWATINLSDDVDRPERYQGARVTANLFAEVGAHPLLGRVFTEDENDGRGTPTIVLGYHVWTTRYSADPGIVGRTMRANGEAAVVIGVMPEGFRFPFDQDLWMPLGLDASAETRGEGIRFEVVGRLRLDHTVEGAQAEMDEIAARLATAYPETNEGRGVIVQRYERVIMPPAITAVMFIMLGAVFGVLFIACANVANLLLARAVTRTREVALRSALGASRSAVIQQLLMEALVLAVIGGAIGVGLGYVGVDLLNASIVNIQKPYWIDARMDTPALLFALAVTVLAAVVSGTAPAFKASGADMGEILKDQNRGSSGLRIGRVSGGLVVAEIALSCCLLIWAGMMIKSVVNLRTLDLGFETANVLTAHIAPPDADYPTRESRQRLFDDLLAELDALPGVRASALTSDLPALGAGRFWFGVEGTPYLTDQDYPFANGSIVSPGFFDVFRVPRLEGRGFTSEDREGSVAVAIVNRSFARRYFGEDGAVGRRFRLGRSDSDRAWLTVVGVVPDLHIGGGVGGLGSSEIIPEQFYLPLAQTGQRSVAVALYTASEPADVTAALRRAVANLDPNLPVYEVDPMDRAIETATWAFGLFGSLFSIFGLIALFMAAVGLYGVMAFSVSRRTQELGIRMALGATARQITSLVFRRGFGQLAVGLGVGLLLGAAMSRRLEAVTYDVTGFDISVYGTIAVTLVVAGILACLVPARRATRIELVEALRPQ